MLRIPVQTRIMRPIGGEMEREGHRAFPRRESHRRPDIGQHKGFMVIQKAVKRFYQQFFLPCRITPLPFTDAKEVLPSICNGFFWVVHIGYPYRLVVDENWCDCQYTKEHCTYKHC